MSHGAGHIQDMINRVKQNAALKNARKGKFKGGNDYSKTKSVKTAYDFPKMSKLEFDTFKKKLKKETKQEQKNKILFWFFVLAVPIIIGSGQTHTYNSNILSKYLLSQAALSLFPLTPCFSVFSFFSLLSAILFSIEKF